MKKRLLTAFSLLMAMCIFTACGSKTAITNDSFASTMESNGLYTQDATLQFSLLDYVEEVTIAADPDGAYQIEFYTFTEEQDAIDIFNTNKSNFEALKGSSSTEKSVEVKNYAVYSLTSNGRYMYVCRIDNTMVYADVDEEYKDAVSDLIDQLGYK